MNSSLGEGDYGSRAEDQQRRRACVTSKRKKQLRGRGRHTQTHTPSAAGAVFRVGIMSVFKLQPATSWKSSASRIQSSNMSHKRSQSSDDGQFFVTNKKAPRTPVSGRDGRFKRRCYLILAWDSLNPDGTDEGWVFSS